MPYAATNLGRLFVRSCGSGPTLTLWNCLFGDASIYQSLVRACDDDVLGHVRFVTVEGPSHGKSEPLRRRFTLSECADAWVQALDAEGITEPSIFCGLSWGSMVALRVALQHPHRVCGLVLMSTVASAPRARYVPQFLSLAAAVRWFGFPDWLIRQMELGMVSRRTRAEQPTLVHDMLARNRHLDRVALSWAAASVLANREDIVDQLWRVRAPTWVLAGSDDMTTPVRAARTVVRAIQDAELRIVEGSGHLLPLEAPEQARSFVREALVAISHRDGVRDEPNV